MLYNKTQRKLITKHVVFVSSLYEMMLGLMFKKNIQGALVFIFHMEIYHSFHTCFMNFPIDIIFLDKKFRVTKVVRSVKPWKLNIFGKGKYVIELPEGKSKNVSVGDVISFK